jgi:hypothetical protein
MQARQRSGAKPPGALDQLFDRRDNAQFDTFAAARPLTDADGVVILSRRAANYERCAKIASAWQA